MWQGCGGPLSVFPDEAAKRGATALPPACSTVMPYLARSSKMALSAQREIVHAQHPRDCRGGQRDPQQRPDRRMP